MLVALGSTYAALISNDDELAADVAAAGERTGELAWRLPLHEEYKQLTKGSDADLTNAAAKRKAGTIYAGSFLEEFVDGKPWAHLDIAGTAWDTGRAYVGKGPTGFGVRLLVELLCAQTASSRSRRRASVRSPSIWTLPLASLPSAARPLRRARVGHPVAAARCSIGTVAKWTMSGRRPAMTRSGFRRSPSSTTTDFGLKAIRSGEKSSSKRKTTLPRITATRPGSRAIPRSISP